MTRGFFDFRRLFRKTEELQQLPSEKIVSTSDFLGKNAASDDSMELHSDERDIISTDDVIAPNIITSPESEKIVSTSDFLGKNAASDDSMELHSAGRDVTSTDDVIAPNAITSPEDEYWNAENVQRLELRKQRLELRKWVLLSLIGTMAVIPIWLMVLLSVPIFDKESTVSEKMQIGYLIVATLDVFGLYYIVTRDLFPNSERGKYTRSLRSFYKENEEILEVQPSQSERHQASPLGKELTEEEVNQLAITELILKKEYQNLRKAAYIYIAFVILLRFLILLLKLDFSSLFFLPIIPILLFYIRIKILEYRVKRRAYGLNAHEAKEVIRFIYENLEEEDQDGGQQRRIPIEPPSTNKSSSQVTPEKRYGV